MNATTRQKSAKTPCGCGNSGAKAKGSCSCGGSGAICSTCQSEAYTRPRFFAGQLLTEDDLLQLNEYVVAKNRLHARHWFGPGVVCGLDVTCYPCGGGKVIVNPGYALDCCGNDIVVSCPEELDINQMIRDLLRKLRGGYDCGDPCPDSAGGSSVSTGTKQSTENLNGGKQKSSEGDTGEKPKWKKYCLYVSYCEKATDPVAPYALDDPCLSPVCEATRVCEGFRFELDCPCPEQPEPQICAALRGCRGDEMTAQANETAAIPLRQYGGKIVAAYQKIQTNEYSKLTQDDISKIPTKIKAVGDAFSNAENAKKVPDTKALLEATKTLRDAAFDLGGELALFLFQPDLKKSAPDLKEEVVSSFMSQGLAALSEPSAFLKEHQNLFTIPLEQAYVSSLSEVIGLLASLADERRLYELAFSPEARAIGEPAKVIQDIRIQFLAQKTVAAKPLYDQMVLSTDVLRGHLTYRLMEQQSKTRCWLLDEVSNVAKLSPVTGPTVDGASFYLAGKTSSTLGRAMQEFSLSCFCDALNPPCPPCDDMRVLLACLTVQDCQVKDICDLDRQFVLSPVALRYWLPEITLMGRSLEKLCCPDECHPLFQADRPDAPHSLGAGAVLDYRLAYLARETIYLGCFGSYNRLGFLSSTVAKLAEVRNLDFLTARTLHPAFVPAEPHAAETAAAPAEAALSVKLMRTNLQLEKLQTDYQRLQLRVRQLERKKAPDPGGVNE